MDIKDINSIGEGKFYRSSLAETLVVLDVLEAQNWFDIRNKALEENSSYSTRLLDIVDDRIHRNDFAELANNAEERNHVLLQVLRIRTNITQYRLLCLRDSVEQTVYEQVQSADDKFRQTEASISKAVIDATTNVQRASSEVRESINQHLIDSKAQFESTIDSEITKTVEKIEPQLISTVLTLMGVFSAIITIIMSVVITSTSWLNNANGASAIIAFAVPSLVVAFSITILLCVVFSRKEGNYVVISEGNWNHDSAVSKAAKKVQRTQAVTIIIVSVFTVVLLSFALVELKVSDEPHTRYILSEDMYKIIIVEAENVEQPVLEIEFACNGKNYRFPYDESYFHDGSLYFCEEHVRLE